MSLNVLTTNLNLQQIIDKFESLANNLHLSNHLSRL